MTLEWEHHQFFLLCKTPQHHFRSAGLKFEVPWLVDDERYLVFRFDPTCWTNLKTISLQLQCIYCDVIQWGKYDRLIIFSAISCIVKMKLEYSWISWFSHLLQDQGYLSLYRNRSGTRNTDKQAAPEQSKALFRGNKTKVESVQLG